jgi:hypothetical protein
MKTERGSLGKLSLQECELPLNGGYISVDVHPHITVSEEALLSSTGKGDSGANVPDLLIV